MKLKIINSILLVNLLIGCVNVKKYDATEYTKIVSATNELSPNLCVDSKTLKTKLDDVANQIDYINIYEIGMPNNKNTINMMAGVVDETSRFENILNLNPTISYTYCKLKIDGMRHTLLLVLKAEGSKLGNQ